MVVNGCSMFKGVTVSSRNLRMRMSTFFCKFKDILTLLYSKTTDFEWYDDMTSYLSTDVFLI